MENKQQNRSVPAWLQTARKLQGVANGAELILYKLKSLNYGTLQSS